MGLLSPQVSAFIAVIEESSFEAAAKRLSVTPSAISQRIKTLEDRVGQLLVIRQTPCRATPAGERLLSKVKPMALLEAEVMGDFLQDEHSQMLNKPLPIAVNEDSLTTWLIKAISELFINNSFLFDIQVDDQDYTLEHLRNGSVLGAITSEKRAIQGCSVHFLGCMRYCAIASPNFYQHYFSQGLTRETFLQAPTLIYNRKDPLQTDFIRKITGSDIEPLRKQYIPNSVQLVEAAAGGMGWCMAAEGLFESALQQGRVVNISPQNWFDVPLYWQHAATHSDRMSKITRVLKQTARYQLHDTLDYQ